MQFTAQELKEQLLRAIDADNNVVDTKGVLGVLDTLEKFPVTKEQLEQTRIGRIVNDLRRKTTDKELAKRAKNLVRKWRDFVTVPTAVPNGPAINGVRLGHGGVQGGAEVNSLPPHLQRGTGSKPASPASGPATPSSGKSSVSPPNSHHGAPVYRPTTPGLHSRLSPRLAAAKPVSPLVNAPYQHTGANNNKNKHSPPNIVIRQGGSPDESTCEIVTPHETVSKVNVANKRKRRGPPPEDAPLKPAKCPLLSDTDSLSHAAHNNGDGGPYKKAINGAVVSEQYSKCGDARARTSHGGELVEPVTPRQVSPASRTTPPGAEHNMETPKQSLNDRRNISMSVRTELMTRLDRTPSVTSERSDSATLDRTPTLRTPKVKTTAELIQELHNKGNMRLSGSKTVTRIAMNQIQKESDVMESIVPPEAKPRLRRKPGSSAVPPPSTNQLLSKAKSEMVQKFLQSVPDGAPASPVMDSSTHGLIDLIQQDNERVDLGASTIQLPGEEDSHSTFISVPSQPAVEIDPWSLLPPLDPDTIDNLDSDTYEAEPPATPTDEDVERLQTEQLPGVNGHYDYARSWSDWTQMYSVPSADTNLLHILPYVCLD